MSWPSDLVLQGDYHIEEDTGNPSTVGHVRKGNLIVINKNPNMVYTVSILRYRDCYTGHMVSPWRPFDIRLSLDEKKYLDTTDYILSGGQSVTFTNSGLKEYVFWGCSTEAEFQYTGVQSIQDFQAGEEPVPVGVEPEAPEVEEPRFEVDLWERIERISLIIGIIAVAIAVMR